MGKIYCILGKSSVGKDSLLNLMVDKGFKRVVSHTSRSRRSNEIGGRDYYFTSKESMLHMIDNNEFVETRSYNVVGNETWYYGVSKKEIDLNSDQDYVCIVDGQGFETLREYYGKENVIGIYLYVSNRERLLRALNRCEVDDRAVDEIIRRYEKDDEAFTSEIINQCVLKVNNVNLNDTLSIVLRNIKNGDREDEN